MSRFGRLKTVGEFVRQQQGILAPREPDVEIDQLVDRDDSDILDELLPVAHDSRAIRKALSSVVIGQADAKNAISVLLSAHLSRNARVERSGSPNALLIGPTGVGKTHTIQTVAEYLRLPYVNVDSTALVPTSNEGGMTIEHVLIELLISAETILAEHNMFSEISAAQFAAHGLVFLDEIDKLRVERENDWNLRVQRRLLRLIEGTFSTIREARGESLDTSRIIFVASGTFDGIRDPAITSRRPPQLNSTLREPDRVVSADLVTYGFLPELIARLPILVDFEQLTALELVEILSNPVVDPTQVWTDHFAQMGKRLHIDDDAKLLIAQNAENLNMGARGLQQVMFPMLARLSEENENLSTEAVVVTREVCEQQIRMGW